MHEFTNDDQTEWTGIKLPTFDKEISWDNKEPFVLSDEDDIALGWFFPEFLKGKAHVSFMSLVSMYESHTFSGRSI